MGKQLEFNWGGIDPPSFKKGIYRSQQPLKIINKSKMYTIPKYPETSINCPSEVEGESLETKVSRMVKNKEPINAEGIGMIYTERKKGVLPETNVRTDRWEIATDAMGVVEKSHKAKRDNHLKIVEGGKSEGQANSQMAENGGVL